MSHAKTTQRHDKETVKSWSALIGMAHCYRERQQGRRRFLADASGFGDSLLSFCRTIRTRPSGSSVEDEHLAGSLFVWHGTDHQGVSRGKTKPRQRVAGPQQHEQLAAGRNVPQSNGPVVAPRRQRAAIRGKDSLPDLAVFADQDLRFLLGRQVPERRGRHRPPPRPCCRD